MSESADATTNLNIRIDKSLKEKLDDFARSNGLQTTTLVISQIHKLLMTKKIDPEILQPTSKREQNKIKRDVDRYL